MAKIDAVDIPKLLFTEGAAPGTPAASKVHLYAKSDGLLYSKDDAGIETVVSGAGVGSTFARKTADQASTSTAFANVTDLTFAVAASTTYRFRFVVFFATSAAGEAIGLSVNGPTGTYKLGGFLPASATNAAGSAIFHSSGAAADSGFLVASAGPGAIPTMAIIEGVVIVGGTGGTLALRMKAETGGANSATVQANSYGEITAF